jgi:hypothetical protein
MWTDTEARCGIAQIVADDEALNQTLLRKGQTE